VDAEAQSLVDRDLEQAIRYANNGEHPDALKIATGIRLVEKPQAQGDHERAIDAAINLADRLTRSGQAISLVILIMEMKFILVYTWNRSIICRSRRLVPGIYRVVPSSYLHLRLGR